MTDTMPRETPKEVGKRIAMLRKENALTQDALADKIDVSRRLVAAWESGERLPDVESWIKLASEFGVSTDFIAGTSMSRTFKAKPLSDKIDITRLNDLGKHMLFEYYHMLIERDEFTDFPDMEK